MSNNEIDIDNMDSSLNEESQFIMEAENNDGKVVSFDLAGLDSRALAFLIDVVLISLVALLAYGIGTYSLKDPAIDSPGFGRAFTPIYLLLFFLASSYFVILNGYSGKTIGKMFMGIKIISDEGNPIGFWQSFVRWIGYYVSGIFLFIGFIWSFFDPNYQSWHDKIAGTYVVKE